MVLENASASPLSVLHRDCSLVVRREEDHWMKTVPDVLLMVPVNYDVKERPTVKSAIHAGLLVFVGVEQEPNGGRLADRDNQSENHLKNRTIKEIDPCFFLP